MIYLDNAADAPIKPLVAAAVCSWMERTGNPGSIHSAGRNAALAIQHAREQTAGLFHCAPENVIFTSGGAEGNNTVVSSFRNVAYSEAEHSSVIHACVGHDREFYPVPLAENHTVDLVKLSELLARHVIHLVCVMAVNNETGVENDIRRVADLCHANNAFLLTDCVQAVGAMELDMERLGCDFATISGHKFGGPKGVGAIYVRRPDTLNALIYGGSAQEFGLRGGTENVPGIVGLGAACTLVRVVDRREDLFQAFLAPLRQALGEDHGIRVNGVGAKILNIGIRGVNAETLLYALDLCGVCVSTGSACNSVEVVPSHVLKAIGLSDEEASESIRISVSDKTTADELREAARITADNVRFLREQGLMI